MTPDEIITELMRRGWSQRQIAERCACTQATISRIHQGKQPTPSYVIVDALRRLIEDLHGY